MLTDVKIYFTNDAKNNEITVFDLDEVENLTFKKGIISPKIQFNNCSICTAGMTSKYGAMLETLLEQAIEILKNELSNSD